MDLYYLHKQPLIAKWVYLSKVAQYNHDVMYIEGVNVIVYCLSIENKMEKKTINKCS